MEGRTPTIEEQELVSNYLSTKKLHTRWWERSIAILGTIGVGIMTYWLYVNLEADDVPGLKYLLFAMLSVFGVCLLCVILTFLPTKNMRFMRLLTAGNYVVATAYVASVDKHGSVLSVEGIGTLKVSSKEYPSGTDLLYITPDYTNFMLLPYPAETVST